MGDVVVTLQLFEQILLPEGYDQPVVATVELRDPSGAVALSDEVTFQPGDADEHGVLAQIWSLDTQGLVTGDYTLRVTAGGAVKTLAVQLQEPPAEPAQPFLNAQPAPPPTDISVALERARQYRAVGDVDQAVVWLRGAIERDPDNDELRAEHVELLESAGMYEELIEVLLPAMIDNPNNVDLLRRLAEAHASAGQHYDAIRYYERLRMVSEEDSPETLNALANEYLADEQPDKARQLFQQSLELNAEQPEVRELLNRIAVPVSESQS